MTIKLFHMLLVGHGLSVKKVYQSHDPKYFRDVTFIQPIPYTIGFKTYQINSTQFPEEVVQYMRFSPLDFRLYFINLSDIKF